MFWGFLLSFVLFDITDVNWDTDVKSTFYLLPKAVGNSMDHSSPGGIQNAKEETFDTQRYIDFLYRAKWKAYQKSPRQHRVGNYLEIIWLRHRNYNRRWITKQLNDKKQQIKKKINTTHQTTHRAPTQRSSGKPREPPNPHTRPENSLETPTKRNTKEVYNGTIM